MKGLRKDFENGKLRRSLLLLSIIAMLAGLLFSRAMLSSALIVFVVVSLFHRHLLAQLKVFFSSPLLWSMSLLFLLPLISGLWTDDLHHWIQILRIKLPLFLLPFCFSYTDNNFSFKEWEKIAFVFLALIFVGICQSLSQYFQNASVIHADYLKAHTIETPMGNDHVRFSLIVAIAILTCGFLLIRRREHKQWINVLLVVMLVIFIGYLHILAARTGLACFYLGSFFLIIWLVRHRKNNSKYFLLSILVLVLPAIAYFALPTFRNRVSYLRYDLSFVQKDVYLPGSNDGNRIASIKAGWELLLQKPLTGVGFGDIRKELDSFYDNNYPQMNEADRILPSSEWVIYGAGNGWTGFIVFSFVMLVPFFVKELRGEVTWLILSFSIPLSYLFDIGLEVQYGIFIHAFFLLWWYKWLRSQH